MKKNRGNGRATPNAIRLGLSLPLVHHFGHRIMEGVAQFLLKRFDVEPTPLPALDWPSLKQICDSGQVDGLIIAPSSPEEFADRLASLSVPVVMVAAIPTADDCAHVGRVFIDQHACGQMACTHLTELGFQRFAFCGNEFPVELTMRGTGFIEALRQAGHEGPVPQYIGPVDHDKLATWLAALPPTVAVYCATDNMAYALTTVAKRIGRVVPEEVAILSTGNDVLTCLLARPTLSSVDINSFGVGYAAATMVLDMMEGRKIETSVRLIPPLHVLARQSTDTLALDITDLQDAMQIIRARACEGLNIDTLVDQLSVSRRKLEVLFRRHIGRTINQEIVRQQLSRAKDLLCHTDLPTPDVASRCGFNYASRLSNVFKRETGLTPTGYRRIHQKRRLGGPMVEV